MAQRIVYLDGVRVADFSPVAFPDRAAAFVDDRRAAARASGCAASAHHGSRSRRLAEAASERRTTGACRCRPACRGGVVGAAPAHGRHSGTHVPREAVRRRGLHELELALGRRPPHARPQRAVPAPRRPPSGVSARPVAGRRGPGRAGARAGGAPAALFEPLARGRWGERAKWGALWFGVGTGALLFTGRLPFAMGVAFGLGALLAM